MSRNWKWARVVLITLMMIMLLSGGLASAGKPVKPPKPGDDDPPEPPPTLNVTFAITSIPLPADGLWVFNSLGLNNSGDMVGTFENDSGDQLGWYYDAASGTTIDLAPLLALQDWQIYGAYDINDKGWIVANVGHKTIADKFTAVIYKPGETPAVEIVDVPTGYAGVIANSINEFGDICGWIRPDADNPNRDTAFVRYTGTVDVFGIGEALSISGSAGNPVVQVVGAPFRYTPALDFKDVYQRGNDINESGQVVGSMIVKRSRKAFRYTDGEGLLDLGVIDRKQGATAYAINDQGTVVGWNGRPFVYLDGFGIAPLDDLIEDSPEKLGWLGSSYFQQIRINNQGQIAVKPPSPEGGFQVLLLTPSAPPSEW